MERIGSGTNTEFFATTTSNDMPGGSPLSESIGTSNELENLTGNSSSGRLAGMLESVGIPRSTTENVMRAVNSPRVQETSKKVTTYVRRHPAQVLGALSAVAAIGTGLAVMKSRRNRVAF